MKKISVGLVFVLLFSSFALSACEKKVRIDTSSPEQSLMTLLSAMHKKDADAFLYCMTDEQLIAYGNSKKEEEARLRESLRTIRAAGHPSYQYEIVKRLTSKGRVRLEFQVKKKFFTNADEEGWKGAHMFIKTPQGWKSYGVDVFREGRWLYTKDDPFTPRYQ